MKHPSLKRLMTNTRKWDVGVTGKLVAICVSMLHSRNSWSGNDTNTCKKVHYINNIQCVSVVNILRI